VGEYNSGDLTSAYEYLGHLTHLLADMSVPAHAHEEPHGPEPFDDDSYEDWMTLANAELDNDEGEPAALLAQGPVVIPDNVDPLYYLFYTTNQVADFFPDDSNDGDTVDNHGGWMDGIYTELGMYSIDKPRTSSDLSDNDNGDDNDDGDLGVIRDRSFKYAIRAVAALYELFDETTSQDACLIVVIDRVKQLECHDDAPTFCMSGPDYFVRVNINGFWFRNEGNQVVNTEDISPGWAFARNVGLTGVVPVVIQLWDEDEDPNDDDPSDIDPVEGARDLDLTVDLSNGAISGDLTGTCGVQLSSWGTDDDRSQIWFRIIMPNIPPTADAGLDQTVDEGDSVTLSGSFTDPNIEDTHTFLWHLESSTNGQTVPDLAAQSLSFTAIDNGVYTFSFTVTDNRGAQGSDIVVVTAENVAPVVSIDSITDETGAEIGVDVPVALVGIGVNLAGSFTDVGMLDTHTAEINWGDGSEDIEGDFEYFTDCTGGFEGFLKTMHIYAVPSNYTITLNVTDNDNDFSTTTAQIEVVDAAGAIASVVESLTPLADEPNVQAAIDKLQGEQDGEASNGALDKLEKGNLNAALQKIKQALEYLEAAEASNPSLDLTYDKGLLALAGKSVVVGAIAEAEAAAFKPNHLLKIQQAKSEVAQGDALLAALNYVGAVDMYQQAVREVQNIP